MTALKVDKSRLPYLEDLALVLENERGFYDKFISMRYARAARDCITEWKRITFKARGVSKEEDLTTADEREFLRRYFNQKWDVDQDGSTSRELAEGPGLPFLVQPVKKEEWTADGDTGSHPNDDYTLTGYDFSMNSTQHRRSASLLTNPIDQPQLTKEEIMSTTITITTKTLINGNDISTYSNAQLYEIIASQEKKITELDAIKNKPKSLKKELAERQDGINALVTYLDSKEEAK